MSYPSYPPHPPYPAFAPGGMPRPRPATPARPAIPRVVPWGWLEWFLIAQTFIPALLFLPGIGSVRVLIRVATFGVALIAWFSIYQSGRALPGARSFKVNPWLRFASGWLLLMVVSPLTNSIPAGLAQAMLYIAVFSPVFWAPSVLASPRQLGRLMMILLLCNGLSALVGLGQVFRPGTFNPPVIPGITSVNGSDVSMSTMALTYVDGSGNKIIRPCGLSDMVGNAAGAGSIAAMVGLAYALRPIGAFKRLACLALAFFGVAVIYYSQVRMVLLMLVICLAVLVAVFVMQKNYGYATLLGGLAVVMIVGALSWVMATSGRVVVERFLGLATDDFSKTYSNSRRGDLITESFTRTMWESPMGAGLGWWGTIYGAFGDKSRPSTVWVEVMIPAWIVDGGIPLLGLYVGAIFVAMGNTLRVALRSRDPEIRFWAAVVLASNLSVVATCFSYVTFVTAIGLQFWLLAAVVHAADVRSRAAAPRARPRPAAVPPSYPAMPPFYPAMPPGPAPPPPIPSGPAPPPPA
jgi:hypothetical protein